MNMSHNYSGFIDFVVPNSNDSEINAVGVTPQLMDEKTLQQLTYRPSPLFWTRFESPQDD